MSKRCNLTRCRRKTAEIIRSSSSSQVVPPFKMMHHANHYFMEDFTPTKCEGNSEEPVNSRVKKFQETWMSYTKAFIEAWPRRIEIKLYKFIQCSATSILKDA